MVLRSIFMPNRVAYLPPQVAMAATAAPSVDEHLLDLLLSVLQHRDLSIGFRLPLSLLVHTLLVN